MRIKESWVAEIADPNPKLVEDWKARRLIKNRPAFTVMKNGYAYHNAFMRDSFYYEDVYYKFTDRGIRFSYYEKRGYSHLKQLIAFPHQYVSETHKNVYILEKVGYMNYEFILDNKVAKIKVLKTT